MRRLFYILNYCRVSLMRNIGSRNHKNQPILRRFIITFPKPSCFGPGPVFGYRRTSQKSASVMVQDFGVLVLDLGPGLRMARADQL